MILRTAQTTGAVPTVAGQIVSPVVAPSPTTSPRLWPALFAVAMLALLGTLAIIFTQTLSEAP